MALTSASASKTASDSNRAAPDVANLTIVAINAGIGAACATGVCVYMVNLDGKITDDVVQVKQSDDGYINLGVIIYALEENGYRVSCNKKNTTGGFKVNLTVAWN